MSDKSKVRKAVFPAAGLGTRFLPATKAMPKEMLPLVDKPLIQYGVEEAIQSDIHKIIIVTGRGKTSMEDHFDHSFELEHTLESRGKKELLATARHASNLADVNYVRQKQALGLGHAVLRSKEMVGDEPFAVVLSDDIIDAEVPALRQMLDVFEKYKSPVIALMEVPRENISAYGVVAGDVVADYSGRGNVGKAQRHGGEAQGGRRAFESRDHRTLHPHSGYFSRDRDNHTRRGRRVATHRCDQAAAEDSSCLWVCASKERVTMRGTSKASCARRWTSH